MSCIFVVVCELVHIWSIFYANMLRPLEPWLAYGRYNRVREIGNKT
jgi:hypothetical protein